MCGRFVTPTAEDLWTNFQVKVPDSYKQSFNCAPTQMIPALSSPHELLFLRWGLIPSWAKDASIGNRMINARAETLQIKPSFKQALMRRRCVIPAQGFYEWKLVGKQKQPFYIFHTDGSLLCFAGLWESWKSPEGKMIQSASVITQEATGAIQSLHSRMPVVLNSADISSWLSPQTSTQEISRLLNQSEPGEITIHAVSTQVNSPRFDSRQCIEPLRNSALSETTP